MNNHPDAVMEQNYENAPPVRPAEPTMRTATTALRRDFFDDPRRKSPRAGPRALADARSWPDLRGLLPAGLHQRAHRRVVDRDAQLEHDARCRTAVRHVPRVLLALQHRGCLAAGDVLQQRARGDWPGDAARGVRRHGGPRHAGRRGGARARRRHRAVEHLFGLPLDWLEKWWPLAPIAVGAWLIYPTFAGKNKTDAAG